MKVKKQSDKIIEVTYDMQTNSHIPVVGDYIVYDNKSYQVQLRTFTLDFNTIIVRAMDDM